jgi:hypothetical protein
LQPDFAKRTVGIVRTRSTQGGLAGCRCCPQVRDRFAACGVSSKDIDYIAPAMLPPTFRNETPHQPVPWMAFSPRDRLLRFPIGTATVPRFVTPVERSVCKS